MIKKWFRQFNDYLDDREKSVVKRRLAFLGALIGSIATLLIVVAGVPYILGFFGAKLAAFYISALVVLSILAFLYMLTYWFVE